MTTPPRPEGVYFGGQAVIEGVMIRGPRHMAVSVRHPAGHIVTHSEPLHGLYTGRARHIPLLRGVLVLAETLALGMRSLSFSSRISMEEKDPGAPPTQFPEKAFWGTVVISLAFVVGIFFTGPILVAELLELVDAGRATIVVVEGVLRLLFFVGYIGLISLLPEVRRVFQYHGAEHMTIHAYEAGRPLNTGEIRRFPKEHTRCGTSFLLVVVFISLMTFFAFDLLVHEGLIVRVLSRVVLLPPIAAVSYELLRLGGRFSGTRLVRILFAPNIALQALTTRAPDDSQIEVAIAAFDATVAAATPVAPSVSADVPPTV
jgi:uncharacterized protein YqhQ